MKIALLSLAVLQYVAGNPLTTLQDLEIADDTAAVGTYVRLTRAAAPEEWQKETEDEGEGEIGYSRLKEGGGKKGYQRFDAYHKKAGDNYALEKEDSFGYDDEGQEGAYSEKQEKKAEPKKPKRDPEYEDHENERTHDNEHDEEARHKYDTKERHYEELKEGASDGNGGVEAQGHDQRDYVLPEKYTWGKDDEYKF